MRVAGSGPARAPVPVVEATPPAGWLARIRVRQSTAVPPGTVAVGGVLVVLGVASYGYLIVAARALTPAQFARIAVVWTVLFTVGPGLFLPLEQDISRRLAAAGRFARPVVTRAAAVGLGLLVVLAGLSAAFGGPIGRRLLGGDVALFAAMLAAVAALVVVHTSRGVLAGIGAFRRYGYQLAADGLARVGAAAALLGLAVHAESWYGWVLLLSQLVAVLLSVLGLRVPAEATHPATGAPEPPAAAPAWSTLAGSLGWLLVTALAAQILANGGTVAVKALARPDDAAAAHFLTALVLARVPLFLFAALQASLLPRMARLVAAGDLAALGGLLRRLLVLLTALGTVATLGLLAVGPDITVLLFGANYDIARWPLVLLSVGSTCFVLASACAQTVIAFDRVGAVAAAWTVGVVVFLAVLAVPLSLDQRAGYSLLAGSVVVLLGSVALLAREFRRAPA